MIPEAGARSLRVGITARIVLLALALGLLALVLAGGRLARRWEATRQRERLAAFLGVVQSSASAACFAEDPLLGQQVVGGLLDSRDVQSARILAGDRVLAEAVRPGSPGGIPVQRPLASPFGGDSVLGSLVLVPDLDEARRQGERTAGLFRGVFLGALAALALGLAAIVRQGLLEPLATLRRDLRSMDGASPRRLRVPAGHARDAVGQLAAEVDALVARLTATRWRQRDRRGQDARRQDMALAVVRADGALEAWTPGFSRILGLAAPPLPGVPLARLLGEGGDRVRDGLASCPPEGASLLLEGAGDALRLTLERQGPGWFRVVASRERRAAAA